MLPEVREPQHSQYFLSGEPDIVRKSLCATAGGSLCALTATGSCLSTTATFPAVHVFSPDSSTDHGPGATDPALYFNSLDRAVEGAGSALHAAGRADKFCYQFSFCKDAMGAYLAATPAVDTPLRMILEGIFPVRVKHQATPRNQRIPARTVTAIPEPAMITITGIYRKISVLTPVRDV